MSLVYAMSLIYNHAFAFVLLYLSYSTFFELHDGPYWRVLTHTENTENHKENSTKKKNKEEDRRVDRERERLRETISSWLKNENVYTKTWLHLRYAIIYIVTITAVTEMIQSKTCAKNHGSPSSVITVFCAIVTVIWVGLRQHRLITWRRSTKYTIQKRCISLMPYVKRCALVLMKRCALTTVIFSRHMVLNLGWAWVFITLCLSFIFNIPLKWQGEESTSSLDQKERKGGVGKGLVKMSAVLSFPKTNPTLRSRRRTFPLT